MNTTQTVNVDTNNRGNHPTLRSIGAVLAGLFAVFILSLGTDAVMHETGVYPPWSQPMSGALFLVATAYRIVYNIAGCYLAGLLAPDRPMLHALWLGIVGLVLSSVGVVATWNAGPEFGPRWYPLALVTSALPCAWVGGRIREMQLRAGAERSEPNTK